MRLLSHAWEARVMPLYDTRELAEIFAAALIQNSVKFYISTISNCSCE